MAEEGEEGKGFKVQDKRRFSPETGEPRDEMNDKVPREPDQPNEGSALPEINFSAFVISLSTQALVHLGEIPNPLDGQVETDVTVAKQMIDILNLLREKTRGNLDPGEQKLMEDILYSLRMRYVEVVKKG